MVRGHGVMVVVVASGAHEHGRGWRISTAAGLMRQLHPVALVRTGGAGGRAERPRARLVVMVEKFWIVEILGCIRGIRRHHAKVRRVMMACAVTNADGAVDQRLRFLQYQKRKMVNLLLYIIMYLL